MNTVDVNRLAHRFDAIALDQLRAQAARLVVENEALRERIIVAEEAADFWSREAIDLQLRACEEAAGTPGITADAHLLVIRPQVAA